MYSYYSNYNIYQDDPRRIISDKLICLVKPHESRPCFKTIGPMLGRLEVLRVRADLDRIFATFSMCVRTLQNTKDKTVVRP